MQQETGRKVILEEGYYLHNFLTLINYVKDCYGTLFLPEELAFYYDFKNLSQGAQRLYVRLITRKGPFFRTDKIKYAEIINLEECIIELNSKGFLELNPGDNLEFILQTITKPEILDLIKENRDLQILPKEIFKSGKEQIVQAILEDGIIVWEKLKQKWTFIYPLKQEIVTIFHILFFGNARQDLSEFILEDLGVLRYEAYKILPEDRFFKERNVIDGIYFISTINIELWEAIELNDLDKVAGLGELIKSYPVPPQLLKKISKVYNTIGRFLEKFSLWQEALSYYALSQIPPARERMVRILDKLGKAIEAYELNISVLENPFDDYEAEFAALFSNKLKKKLGIPVEKKKQAIFKIQEFVLKKNPLQNIEITVLEAYTSNGFHGFYAENTIWKSLFGLAFWDIIFMSVPDVFFNPFQRGPTDLFHTDFKKNRENEINTRIREISSDPNLADKIGQLYEKKHKTANLLVDWKNISPLQLKKLIDWIPRKHIVDILSRMCNNLGDFKTGFPDLMLFYPTPGQYLLVEVKGPGDQLHPNQKGWLRFFEEKKIPYEVAKIKWQPDLLSQNEQKP